VPAVNRRSTRRSTKIDQRRFETSAKSTPTIARVPSSVPSRGVERVCLHKRVSVAQRQPRRSKLRAIGKQDCVRWHVVGPAGRVTADNGGQDVATSVGRRRAKNAEDEAARDRCPQSSCAHLRQRTHDKAEAASCVPALCAYRGWSSRRLVRATRLQPSAAFVESFWVKAFFRAPSGFGAGARSARTTQAVILGANRVPCTDVVVLVIMSLRGRYLPDQPLAQSPAKWWR
jgi:hypothetical protein